MTNLELHKEDYVICVLQAYKYALSLDILINSCPEDLLFLTYLLIDSLYAL